MNLKAPKHCLVVEDNKICQDIYNIIFKQLNCPITLTASAKETLTLINRHHYNCIILDWGLPDCGDESLLKAILASSLNKTTPIFVISAHISEEMRGLCQKMGVQDVYSKPINLIEVKALLASCL